MDENLVHIKLEYMEAVQSKRNVLSLEMNLLNIIKIVRRYYSLKTDELRSKTELIKKIKIFSTEIKNLQTTLPKSKVLKSLKEGEEETGFREKKDIYDESLESQLKEIQEKLKSLGRY